MRSVLSELAMRLSDDGTPSISALHMARDAIAKATGGGANSLRDMIVHSDCLDILPQLDVARPYGAQ